MLLLLLIAFMFVGVGYFQYSKDQTQNRNSQATAEIKSAPFKKNSTLTGGQNRKTLSSEKTASPTSKQAPAKASAQNLASPQSSAPGSNSWFKNQNLVSSASLSDTLQGSKNQDFQYASLQAVPLRWDSSCDDHRFRSEDDLSALAKQKLGLNAQLLLPNGALPLQFSLFWKAKAEFFQASFSWEYDDPATFTLNTYKSNDPQMLDNVTETSKPKRMRPSQVKSWIEKMMTSPDIEMGARVARMRSKEVLSKQEAESAEVNNWEVQVFNNQVTQINAAELNCSVNLNQIEDPNKVAYCRCEQGGAK